MNAKVLLVSNDVLTGQLWLDNLSQSGLKVVVADSAEEGLACWSKETFDLVVIDVGRPQLDEVKLCRRLRTQRVKLILLTYNPSKRYMLKAFEAGVDSCIVKPISPCLFLARIRALLRRM